MGHPGEVLGEGLYLSRNCEGPQGESRECLKVPVICIQGETDSFGFERLFFCESHYQELLTWEKKERACDRCKTVASLAWFQDPEDRTLSEVCGTCLSHLRELAFQDAMAYEEALLESKYGGHVPEEDVDECNEEEEEW